MGRWVHSVNSLSVGQRGLAMASIVGDLARNKALGEGTSKEAGHRRNRVGGLSRDNQGVQGRYERKTLTIRALSTNDPVS